MNEKGQLSPLLYIQIEILNSLHYQEAWIQREEKKVINFVLLHL